jgi:hypothetical protein
MLKNYRQLFRKMLTKKCWYHLQKMLMKNNVVTFLKKMFEEV